MSDKIFVLGEQTPAPTSYSPEVLFPIPRAVGRASIDSNISQLPMFGVDVWHIYELSWLNADGVPQVFVGRLSVPCESTFITESKSLKLYLNSLNLTRFNSVEEARNVIQSDVSKVVNLPVNLDVLEVDDPLMAGSALDGDCLDRHGDVVGAVKPAKEILRTQDDREVERTWYTHKLRSLCPVTAQPDWASVQVRWCGPNIDERTLLQYLLSFHTHQEYHEQCLERIYCDLWSTFTPRSLAVQAFYTRRGGIDITPFRASDPSVLPRSRMPRQ